MLDPLIIAFDLVAITVLAYGVYFRRHRRPDMPLAFVGLNVGVVAVTGVLATAEVGFGLGLGLFGVLSLIRLRSSEIAHEEVAYYFASLTMGLVAGFGPQPRWVAPALITLVVATVTIADHPRVLERWRRQTMTLDSAYTDEAQVVAVIEAMVGAPVRRAVVTHVDLVRDLTVVDVRFRAPTGTKSPAGGARAGRSLHGRDRRHNLDTLDGPPAHHQARSL